MASSWTKSTFVKCTISVTSKKRGKSGEDISSLQYVSRASFSLHLSDLLQKKKVCHAGTHAEQILRGMGTDCPISRDHGRVVELTAGVSFAIIECIDGDGLAAWRLLARKFSPTAHASCVQSWGAIVSVKSSKNEEIFGVVVRWEAMLARPANDHNELLLENTKIALIL